MTYCIIIDHRCSLEAVAVERTCYRDAYKASQEKLKATFTNSDGVVEPPLPSSHTTPLSHKMEVHYSFDMAQQVHAL